TMLSLAETKTALSVICDQWGSPTYSYDAARVILDIAEMTKEPGFKDWGTYHYAGDKLTNWHDFAKYIFEQHQERGGKVPETLTAIASSQYPQKAVRPKYSFLSCDRLQKIFGLLPCEWEKGV